MKKLVFLIVFVIAFCPGAFAEQLMFHVRWEDDSFQLKDIHASQGTAKTPGNGKVYSDYYCVGQDKNGNAVSIQEIEIPDKFHYDGLDANGNLQGGCVREQSGDFIIKVPYDNEIRKVSIYKGSEKSVSISDLSRKVLQGKEPEVVFEIPKDLKSTPRISYSDVGDVHKLWGTGPDSNRVVWAILAEGYTSSEQNEFLEEAQTAIDELLQMPPYNDYCDYMNIYAVEVFSQESGSDHPEWDPPQYVETAFQSTYNYGGVPWFLIVPDGLRNKVYGVAAEKVPGYDTIIVLVNDDTYGGAGGPFSVISTNPELGGELMAHEVGHSLYDLDDEYYCLRWSNDYPNVDNHYTYESIKWKHWVEPDTPMPTEDIEANKDLVGAFGIFRNPGDTSCSYYQSRHTCKMEILTTKPDFCQACQEAILVGTYKNSIYKKVSMVEGVTPPAGVCAEEVPNYLTLSVQALQTTSNSVKFYWYVDDVLIPSLTGPSVFIPQALLPDGEHDIKVIVQDETERVRHDPEGFMTDQIEWSFRTKPVSGISGDTWESY